MPALNLALATQQGDTLERDMWLRKKAVDMYKAGVPVSVISTVTGMDEARLNALLDSVDLSDEDLRVRAELLQTYTKNSHAQMMARQARRQEAEIEILDTVEDSFKNIMFKGFARLQHFVADTDLEDYKDAISLMNVMAKGQEIWARFNEAMAARDAKMMATIMKQFELERTETFTNQSNEPVQLDKEGNRPPVEEDSVSRTITLKLKQKSPDEQ